MSRTRRRLLATLLGAVLCLFAAAPMASATTGDLGGMELNEYCQAMHYQGAETIDNGNSNPWVCYYGNGAYWTPLNLFAACDWQFSDLVRVGFNVRYVGNGRCWAINAIDYSSPSDMPLGGYCKALGYNTPALDVHNVAGWRCVGYNGVHYAIDLHAACRWLNPTLVTQGYSLVSYFNSYGDVFGIRCLAMKHS